MGESVLVVFGKLIGCGFGLKLVGFFWEDLIVVGIGMGGRGSLELVIFMFGFSMGLID